MQLKPIDRRLARTVICALALVFPATAARGSLLDNLLGYWQFDGDGTDSSFNCRDLTLVGGAGFAAGQFGQALDLHHNNSQYATLTSNNSVFDFGSGDFSVQVWANYNSITPEMTLIEKFTGSSGPNWSLTSHVSGGGTSQFYSAAGPVLDGFGALGANAWHQFIVRRSGSQFDLFNNGSVVASGTMAGSLTPTSNPLLIGKRNDSDGRDFSLDGRLDEIAIWNRALSASEIAGLYNNGAGATIEPAVSAPPLYHFQPLGDGVASTSTPFGVNSLGQVAGTLIGGSTGTAFRTAPNTPINPNTDLLGDVGSAAFAINNSGQVVGSFTPSGQSTLHAFLTQPNGPIDPQTSDLGTIGSYPSIAYAVNASGQVVGEAGNPFLYSNGQMYDLGTLGGSPSGKATGINDQGQVVGVSNTAGNATFHAFLYSDGQMQDLGTIGDVLGNSTAFAINNAGQIVGSSSFPSGGNATHAFLYCNGEMHDLGTLGAINSTALAINSQGDIVGFTSGIGVPNRPFLYHAGQMYDLNSLLDASGAGIGLESAFAINDLGQIVGTSNGRAYLLSPIPEPSSIVLAALGLVGLLACNWRRRSRPLWPWFVSRLCLSRSTASLI